MPQAVTGRRIAEPSGWPPPVQSSPHPDAPAGPRASDQIESTFAMTEYAISLRFDLPSPTEDAARYLFALHAAGFRDATIGVGVRGRIGLDFTRPAADGERAIAAAITAVTDAIPGATFSGMTFASRAGVVPARLPARLAA